jgi:ABC-type taurine transport system substrate-binding protein
MNKNTTRPDRKMDADIIHSVLKKDGKVFMAIEEFIQKDCGTLDTEVIGNNFGEMFTMKTTEFVEAYEEYRKKFKINGSHVYVMSSLKCTTIPDCIKSTFNFRFEIIDATTIQL